jgi:hypothetical protein
MKTINKTSRMSIRGVTLMIADALFAPNSIATAI